MGTGSGTGSGTGPGARRGGDWGRGGKEGEGEGDGEGARRRRSEKFRFNNPFTFLDARDVVTSDDLVHVTKKRSRDRRGGKERAESEILVSLRVCKLLLLLPPLPPLPPHLEGQQTLRWDSMAGLLDAEQQGN
eukprot:765678-Hanusia_phi.AAC.2